MDIHYTPMHVHIRQFHTYTPCLIYERPPSPLLTALTLQKTQHKQVSYSLQGSKINEAKQTVLFTDNYTPLPPPPKKKRQLQHTVCLCLCRNKM